MTPRYKALVFLLLTTVLAPAMGQQVEIVQVIGGVGNLPHNMATDSGGNILVPDFGNDRVRKLDANGDLTLSWGTNGSDPGQFDGPVGIAVDSADNVYVVELRNDRVQKFDDAGNFITQWGSQGSGNGQFSSPSGIAVDAGDNVWVADRSNDRIQKFSSSGVFMASFGASGSGPGQLRQPTGIGIAPNGDLLIADQGNERIQRFDSDFSFLLDFGSLGAGPGQFDNPSDVAASGDGRLFVADKDNHRIQVFSSSGTYLGEFGGSGSDPGELNQPRGVIVDGDQIFVADRNNNRIQQFRDAVAVVDQKFSGSWFDSSHDGEGWKIEILPNGLAVIYWFTYPPPGFAGEQAWIGGVGRIEGNQIIVEAADSFIATGGVFGDPNRNVTISTWGGFTFFFEDENNGTMAYSGPPGWGSGDFDIQRLTNVIGTPASDVTNLGQGISGSWIAASDFENEGWLIEVIGPQQALIYWFTYDDSGNQAWNIGVGTMVANSILVLNPLDASGTVFGPGFDPADVNRQSWGSYIFTFDSCDAGAITYFNGKGLGSSQIALSRLTFLDGAPCSDFVRTKGEEKPTLGAVCTNPDDPTLLISFRDDGHNGLYFGDKTADGLAQSLDKILIKPVPGAEGEADTVIDVMDDGMTTMVADVASGNMVGIELDATSDDIVLTGLDKGGDLQSIVSANLASLFGPGDKRRKAAPAEHGEHGTGRSGPVTVWGSELKSIPPLPLPAGSVEAIDVSITRCGAPVTEAEVSTTISSDENSGVSVLLAGRQTSDGVYRIPVPTSDASTDRAPDDTQCGGFVDQAGDACTLFDRLRDRNFPLLCANTASGMADVSAPEAKLAQAAQFFISCASALASGKLACDSAGSQQAAGNQDRQDYVCSDAVAADRALNGPLFNLEEVRFSTTLKFPGSTIAEVPFVDDDTYPAGGPFPSYNFILDGDPSIDKFFTTPSMPDPRRGYQATVQVGCLPNNSVVDMSVTGSDGFTGFGSCIISGNGECNLDVPPSDRQTVVRDTITVTVPGAEREVQIVF